MQILPEHSANRFRDQKAIDLARVWVTQLDLQPAYYVALAIHAIITEGQR